MASPDPTQMTTVAARVAALCDVIQEHRRTGTAISGRQAAAISAMIDDVAAAAAAAEGRPRAWRRRRRMANARGYKQEGRRQVQGEGEHAVVVRARHRGTGQAVAVSVKSLHRRSGGSLAADVLRVREACFTAAGGGHPSLVAFRTADYSIDTDDHVGRWASLRAVMADDDRPLFPEADARRVMRQLLAGAEALHRHGVVHRDIKPDNILVCDGAGGGSGAVRICNYAVVKSVAEKDPPQAFAGTMAYMAPEVLVKNADHGTLADVWSLGCVMAEILTGRPPFAVAGKDEDDVDEAMQLFKIFDVLGVPCKRAWQALKSQVHDDKVQVWRARQLRARHGSNRNRLRELVSEEVLSGDGFQVLKGLLTCDPEKRLTAAAALRCPWFTNNVDDDAVASERTTAATMIAAVASKSCSLATSLVRRVLALLQL